MCATRSSTACAPKPAPPKLVVLDLSAAPHVDLQSAHTLGGPGRRTRRGRHPVPGRRGAFRRCATGCAAKGVDEKLGGINRFTSVADAVEAVPATALREADARPARQERSDVTPPCRNRNPILEARPRPDRPRLESPLRADHGPHVHRLAQRRRGRPRRRPHDAHRRRSAATSPGASSTQSLYLMGCLAEQGRELRALARRARGGRPAGRAQRIIADALPPLVASDAQAGPNSNRCASALKRPARARPRTAGAATGRLAGARSASSSSSSSPPSRW